METNKCQPRILNAPQGGEDSVLRSRVRWVWCGVVVYV